MVITDKYIEVLRAVERGEVFVSAKNGRLHGADVMIVVKLVRYGLIDRTNDYKEGRCPYYLTVLGLHKLRQINEGK